MRVTGVSRARMLFQLIESGIRAPHGWEISSPPRLRATSFSCTWPIAQPRSRFLATNPLYIFMLQAQELVKCLCADVFNRPLTGFAAELHPPPLLCRRLRRFCPATSARTAWVPRSSPRLTPTCQRLATRHQPSWPRFLRLRQRRFPAEITMRSSSALSLSANGTTFRPTGSLAPKNCEQPFRATGPKSDQSTRCRKGVGVSSERRSAGRHGRFSTTHGGNQTRASTDFSM